MKMVDLEILLSFHKENIPPSITELSKKTGRPLSTIHQRLTFLERKQLISPPPEKGMARARRLTDFGKNYLEENGYVPADPVFDP